jgi:transcriptional regulator with XRE-family HTH domain
MMQGSLAERLRVLRAQHGLSLTEASEKIGVNRHTLRDLELGKREPYGPTIRKIAEGYGVPVARLLEEPVLLGKDEAPVTGRPAPAHIDASQLAPLLDEAAAAVEDERRTAWESAVENARGLRESGQTRMTELLSLWRASSERQEDADARLEYRLEMADLLTQAQKAETDLFRNFTGSSPEARRAYKEAKKAGAREVPNADWEEFREAARFYYRLRGMVEGFELTVLTGDAAAAAEQATADEAAAEHVQSETTPHRVEERKVA